MSLFSRKPSPLATAQEKISKALNTLEGPDSLTGKREAAFNRRLAGGFSLLDDSPPQEKISKALNPLEVPGYFLLNSQAKQELAEGIALLHDSPPPDGREFGLLVHRIRNHIVALAVPRGGELLERAGDALSDDVLALGEVAQSMIVWQGMASLREAKERIPRALDDLRASQKMLAESNGRLGKGFRAQGQQGMATAVGLLQLIPPSLPLNAAIDFGLCVHQIKDWIAAIDEDDGGDLLNRGAEALPSSKFLEKAELLGTLAVYYEHKADFGRAIDAQQRAVAALDPSTGADAKVRLRCRKDLAKFFLNAQRYAECIALLRELEPQVAAEFGDFSEQNGDLLDTLALALSRSEKAEEALNAAQQSLEIFQQVEGENSLRAARVLGILMPGIYSTLGQTEMREVVQRRAVKMFEARSEELDREPGAIMNYSVVLGNLGSTLALRGEWSEAEQLMVRSLNAKVRIHGNEANPAFIPILIKLGGVEAQLGKFKDAETSATDAVKICRKFLGESHPETQQANDLLQRILNDPRRQA